MTKKVSSIDTPGFSALCLGAMHELPTAEKILSIVLRHAEQNRVSHILTIRLEVGAMSGFETVWLQRYFDKLSAGTPAGGAKLEARTVPVRAVCGACGREYEADLRASEPPKCPACGAARRRIIAGDEFRVKDMEAI